MFILTTAACCAALWPIRALDCLFVYSAAHAWGLLSAGERK